jgi:alginate O-acetyltransferase complex protein AlgI
MVFNSLTFVVFFACVLGLHSLPLPWTAKKINLLVASYLFYAAWNPPFVILLWVSTVVDWYAAQGLVKARREAARHAWMLLSVIANLGMLGYFKYGQFLLDNFVTLMSAVGIDYHPAHYDIVLPVGISFYTFATMSYTLDVYLRRAAPARNLLDYALFVTFFPHLVAGPIMRPTELVPQFAQPRRATAGQLRFGLALMTLGLFNKIVQRMPSTETSRDANPLLYKEAMGGSSSGMVIWRLWEFGRPVATLWPRSGTYPA